MGAGVETEPWHYGTIIGRMSRFWTVYRVSLG